MKSFGPLFNKLLTFEKSYSFTGNTKWENLCKSQYYWHVNNECETYFTGWNLLYTYIYRVRTYTTPIWQVAFQVEMIPKNIKANSLWESFLLLSTEEFVHYRATWMSVQVSWVCRLCTLIIRIMITIVAKSVSVLLQIHGKACDGCVHPSSTVTICSNCETMSNTWFQNTQQHFGLYYILPICSIYGLFTYIYHISKPTSR